MNQPHGPQSKFICSLDESLKVVEGVPSVAIHATTSFVGILAYVHEAIAASM